MAKSDSLNNNFLMDKRLLLERFKNKLISEEREAEQKKASKQEAYEAIREKLEGFLATCNQVIGKKIGELIIEDYDEYDTYIRFVLVSERSRTTISNRGYTEITDSTTQDVTPRIISGIEAKILRGLMNNNVITRDQAIKIQEIEIQEIEKKMQEESQAGPPEPNRS